MVLTIGVVNVAALGFVGYSYLSVLDIAFEVTGVTQWLNPPLVAILTIGAVGALALAVIAGTHLLRSPNNPRERLAAYCITSAINVAAAIGVTYNAVVTIN